MGSRIRDDGISEVIGFVFILALIMTALSIYLVYGVPIQGREDEIKEMDLVRGWFVDYKTGLDQLWMASPGLASDPDEYMAFNTTIGSVTHSKTLDPGTARVQGFMRRYLPVFSPIHSSGAISVTDIGEKLMIVAIRGEEMHTIHPYNATALIYESNNNYWLQQRYSYQLGGVFLNQWDSKGGEEARNMSVVAAPPLSIHPYTGSASPDARVSVALTVVNLSDMVDTGIGSRSPVRVQSALSREPITVDPDGTETNQPYDRVVITFQARDTTTARAWEQVFAGAARRNGISVPPDPEAWCTTGSNDTNAWIDITGPPNSEGSVSLDLLVADYTMRLSNVPTMIE